MSRILIRSIMKKNHSNTRFALTLKYTFQYLILTMGCTGLGVISGCGQQEEGAEQVEVIDTGTGSQAVSTEAVSTEAITTSAQEDSVPSTLQTKIPAGTYTLQLGKGTLTLNSEDASRIAIIEDVATQLGIELIKRGDIDALVSVGFESVSMAELLDNLFGDIAYVAGYAKSANNEGFRLKHLMLGSSSPGTTTPVEQGTGIDLSSVAELPRVSGDIFLGSDAEEVELAQRLQFGSAEDRAIAVSELMMDPTGFNAAYQTFLRDDSPEVRLAVLELVESEDYFLARQMVVASLQDPDKDIVLYALEIVDSLGDFSLAASAVSLSSCCASSFQRITPCAACR